MPKETFFQNRLRSVGFALKGAFLLLKTEASIKVQFFIALVVTAAGFYYDLSNMEWIVQCFAIGLVMGIEGMNTAIEKLADFVQPEHDVKIGIIKDVSAGAVMIVCIVATIIGCIIYFPKIF